LQSDKGGANNVFVPKIPVKDHMGDAFGANFHKPIDISYGLKYKDPTGGKRSYFLHKFPP
jgi:hypothetical protein